MFADPSAILDNISCNEETAGDMYQELCGNWVVDISPLFEKIPVDQSSLVSSWKQAVVAFIDVHR